MGGWRCTLSVWSEGLRVDMSSLGIASSGQALGGEPSKVRRWVCRGKSEWERVVVNKANSICLMVEG